MRASETSESATDGEAGRLARTDRWLIGIGFTGVVGLAAALWVVNGPGAFASMLTGLWAMCF